jgi:hypothetical protein
MSPKLKFFHAPSLLWFFVVAMLGHIGPQVPARRAVFRSAIVIYEQQALLIPGNAGTELALIGA